MTANKRVWVLVGLGTAFGTFGCASQGTAQAIENGIGILCDSPQHVEDVILLHADSRNAVEQVNAASNARVCEITDVAFLVGGIISEASNDQGTWEIRRILIVGLYVGARMNPVQPYEKYTAFLTSKASPI
jgi:hypothetical protein